MEKKSSKTIILATCLFLAGCSINYQEEDNPTTKSDIIADSVMNDFKMVQIRNNTPYTVINSETTEIFNNQNKTVMNNINFTEYGSTVKIVNTNGRADSAEFNNKSENANLSGNINFYSNPNNIRIFADKLDWNSDLKQLSSSDTSLVSIEKDDGSTIEGLGFSADLKNSTFKFTGSVKGVTK